MTQYEAILNYFKLMDAEILELALDENYLYQGVKKSTFVHYMNRIFERMKAKGDTNLILEKGKCLCPKCQSPNMFGWSFIGNKSRSSFNFMFYVVDDLVKNIYYCTNFYEENGIVVFYDWENEKSIQIDFYYSIDVPPYLRKYDED
jgi:hypothetical protein